MPAISTGRVLVTGANGYIAVWVIKDLLETGFSVRGTVRSESKATYLRDRFRAFEDKLEIVVVKDITTDGVFDTFTTDVDAIMHIASPAAPNLSDPEDFIRPAVRGTTSILHSAVKNRGNIKRITVMSSVAAIFSAPLIVDGVVKTRLLDERDWNEVSVAQVREKGKDAEKINMYRASKVLAERAAWDLWESEKARLAGEGGLGWDLVVINSPWVFGPVAHEVQTLESFGSTQSLWYMNVVKGGPHPGNALTKNGFEWVDVRDVARAHVLAITVPDAGGERFIVRGGRAYWQDFVNAAHRFSDKIVPGDDPTYNSDDAVHVATYDASKSVRILGIKYHTLEELTKDSLGDFRTKAWL